MGVLRRWVVPLATAVLLAPAPPASALPGDPPVQLLYPADGASVPARSISVSFACPEYRKAVFVSGEQEVPEYGSALDYSVRFSASPALGADGRLRDTELGSALTFGSGGTCSGNFAGAGGSSDPSVSGGRVFWQANRPCPGCASEFETSPVASFVADAGVEARLRTPTRLYGGYLGVFTVATVGSVPAGASVRLERKVGRRWKMLTTEPLSGGATMLVAKLPTGRQQVRAVISSGTARATLTPKKLTVRRARSAFPRRQDGGRYRDRKAARDSPLSFTVRRGSVRGFKAPVATFCAGPEIENNAVTVSVARLGSARIAPDGRVVGVVRGKNGARELLSGRLQRGRFVGSVEFRLPNCTGTRRFTASRG